MLNSQTQASKNKRRIFVNGRGRFDSGTRSFREDILSAFQGDRYTFAFAILCFDTANCPRDLGMINIPRHGESRLFKLAHWRKWHKIQKFA